MSIRRFVFRRAFVVVLAGAMLAGALSAAGRTEPADIWIKADAGGDGASKESPSGKLHELLAVAIRGDVFHIAQGEYYGRSDTGEFAVNTPNLTLAGGYSADFSERNPFVHLSVLKRKAGVKTDYTKTLGGIIAMDPDAHAEGRIASSSGLILDGLVLDGANRNDYTPNDKRLIVNGSWKEPIIKLVAADFFTSANIKIRNCVIINGYYQGIYVKWQGDGNEISNCLIVNNMINGIDATGALGSRDSPEGKMPESFILIRNNTIGFNWDHDKAHAGRGIAIAGGGKLVDNVIAYLQGGFREAVQRSPDTVQVSGNVFWVCTETDADLLPEGNAAENPALKPNKDYFESFSGFAAKFGKIPLDVINKEREGAGFPPIEKLGAATTPESVAYGKEYPVSPSLATEFRSSIAGKGFQAEAAFAAYSPRRDDLPGARPAAPGEYQEITWDKLKGKANAGTLEGKRIKILCGFNPRKAGSWAPKLGIDAVDYVAWELRKAGSSQENVPEKIMAYALIGSSAANRFNIVGNKQNRKKSWIEGLWVYGSLRANSVGSYPWCLVVEAID